VYELRPSPDFDFNRDGVIDGKDIAAMVDHWHTGEPRYDIAPLPMGDGIVDVQDMVLLSEHLFEDYRLDAHWAFDDAEDGTAFDSAGASDGYIVGNPVWLPDGGHVGGAILLDGVDDYIGTPFVRNPGDRPFSVFAWINGGAPGQVILSQFEGKEWLSVDSIGVLRTDLKGENRARPLSSQAMIVDGSWHRVGLTWDGVTRSLYVDDVLAAADKPGRMPDASGGLNLGCGPNLEPGSYFSGLVDDVRIYNRAVRP
jgi:hypothetical protein